ncbi:MAG: 2-oxoacid:acceptor oxidoreductase family protein [Deltaproteobacteria bacterium]|nr:2-oxoacid:acceptor oxidoreductase family protein [Deltaproteobacteria bacterium]
MDLQMVIAGLGGEGIIFMTRVLVEGLYRCGQPVISTETHGMAMRGGSVISQIKIGDYQSPLIRYGEADLLVGTSLEEAHRNLPYLKEGGIIIKNTPQKGVHCIDASAIAHKIGNPRGGNLVLLGYVLAHLVPAISIEPFLEVTGELTPEKFLTGNLKALQEGWQVVLQGNKEEDKAEEGNQAAREN